jgi:hypothetical protein
MVDVEIPPQVWFPVVTLVAGAVLKGVFDALADRRARLREREARREQRRDALMLRRAEFQRTVLLELQETVSQLARATGQILHEDLMTAQQGVAWGKNRISEAVNDGHLLATTRVNQLRVRIQDEQVRELANEFTAACASAGFTRDEAEARASMKSVLDIHLRLMERLGSVLRALDDDEDRVLEP